MVACKYVYNHAALRKKPHTVINVHMEYDFYINHLQANKTHTIDISSSISTSACMMFSLAEDQASSVNRRMSEWALKRPS